MDCSAKTLSTKIVSNINTSSQILLNKTNRSNDVTVNPLISILYLELQEEVGFRGFYGVSKKFQEVSKEF